MSLGLFVYDSRRARYSAELTPDVQSCRFDYNEHGCVRLDATIRASLWDQANYLVSAGGQLELQVITQPGRLIWAGRLEQPTVRSDGMLGLRAWGYWRALTDVPYLALHSDVGYARWDEITVTDVASAQSQMWEQDKYNRLYTAPRLGETHSTTTRSGWKYLIPNGSTAQIVALEFTYDFLQTLNWQFRVERRDSALTFLTTIATIVAAGAAFVSYTFAACDAITIMHWKNAAAAAYPNPTGVDDRLILTNLRVKSTTAAAVTGSSIVTAALAAVRAVNSGQLSAETMNIVTTTDDQERALYEDVSVARMLTELAERGDGAAVYEVGVDAEKKLFYRPRYSKAQTYYADIVSLEVQADTDDLYNSAYAVYRDDNRRTQRTAVAANATSVSRHNLTRRLVVSAESTTSATTAGTARDVEVAVRAGITPRVMLEIDLITNARGGIIEPWDLQPGDALILRGVTPFLPDNLGTVRITGLELTHSAEMKIQAATKLPFLENMVSAASSALLARPSNLMRAMLSPL